ncbi:ABC transporter substrate-binding protein [Flavobacterium microcysteis]|uniref:ABC transporter substrate-binding protein n=1 Tax=Flavobacterium microcysteis TaxID=2596891 RepID=A0A501QME1_9FLAO|nr:ABC transporter substrate-binding protein [Flavobacterium microcysteis]TPD73365.1 ABC transporter substrate-binding protein [Flavobacterium microcysteis]
MKSFLSKYSLFLFLLFAVACKKNDPVNSTVTEAKPQNSIRYAKGFEIYKHEGYSIVKVSNPWPEANKTFTYVLHKKGISLPDSLKNYTSLQVPIKSVVVTSTTHIPSLEMLGVENTLLGFPDTNLISSEKTRKLIDAGKVKEVGANQSLNTERLIDLDPEALVGYSSGSDTKTYDNLQKSGLKVFFNGDWMEESPLGKAEWIKFFGALYGLDEKADLLFSEVETAYKEATELAKKATTKPTVLSGAIYKEQWYMPRGNSWAATFLKDANAAYLWADSEGTGSLALSFETVMEKAENVDFWIGPAQFTTFKEMTESNPNYAHFKAFKNKNIYSFSSKKGKTGGILYYELASNRPDLILKDLIKILHPELLPEYELYIFEKLK